MNIKKVCRFQGTGYNLLPAILVKPMPDGFTIAFKFWNRHFGLYIVR